MYDVLVSGHYLDNKTSEIIRNSTRSSPLETSEGVVDIPSNSSCFYEYAS